MTPAELAKKLEKSPRWVHRHQDDLRFLELTKWIGHDRYSPMLVEQYLSGQPVVNFGAGRLKARA